jgi:nucleotide-binding universal stress UspA family protein
MFSTILVPLDGTPQSAAALPLARTLGRASRGALHLLHVSSDSRFDMQRATSYLEPIAAELGDENLRVDCHVVSGEPVAEIIGCARACGADLIVMSTHSAAKHSILALASVARYVVTESPVPVLLLHPGGKRVTDVRTLLVPVDGTPGGALAVAAARPLAASSGGHIVLLDVVAPVDANAVNALVGMTVGGFIDPGWEELSVDSATSYVHALQHSLESVGVECEAHVARGHVIEEILGWVNKVDADLVVMSSHALGWPDRAYAASMADRVLSQGRVPVMFVRREPTVEM